MRLTDLVRMFEGHDKVIFRLTGIGETEHDTIEFKDCIDTIEAQQQEIDKLQQWVNDLQAGMYVNCVYCGHRYGMENDTPVAMADVLKGHIEHCPKHPMSKLKQEIDRLKATLDDWKYQAKCDADHIWALISDKDEQAGRLMKMDYLLRRTLPILEVANDQQGLIEQINELLGGKEDA